MGTQFICSNGASVQAMISDLKNNPDQKKKRNRNSISLFNLQQAHGEE